LRCPQWVGLLSTLNPPLTITKIKFGSSLSIPLKRKVIQTSQDSITHLGDPGKHLAI
jgi:hypothetical protein